MSNPDFLKTSKYHSHKVSLVESMVIEDGKLKLFMNQDTSVTVAKGYEKPWLELGGFSCDESSKAE